MSHPVSTGLGSCEGVSWFSGVNEHSFWTKLLNCDSLLELFFLCRALTCDCENASGFINNFMSQWFVCSLTSFIDTVTV